MKTLRICLTVPVLVLIAQVAVAQELESGIDDSGIDKSIRIQDDLFGHVNGRWLKTTEIPSDKSNYGSFTQLQDLSQERLREIIDRSADADSPTGEQKMVGDMYSSFMDEQTIEKHGIDPISDHIRKIRSLSSKDEVLTQFGRLRQMGVSSPMPFFVGVDQKNSQQYLATIVQGGTTLPDRDYYLNDDDEKYAAARAALKSYIATLLKQAGNMQADEAAEQILELERKLADAQWTRTELRDANKRYNKFAVEDLTEVASELNWNAFFDGLGVTDLAEINVATPSFFTKFETVFAETPLETWKNYLEFHLIDAAAPFLSKKFVDAHFELHDKTIAGVPEQQPRWKRAVEAVAGRGAGDFGVLGEMVGRLYVEEYFTPQAKARMDELVANLLKAYKSSIDDLTWMTPVTKKRAQEKLAKITTKIGYPEKWRDYSSLEVKPDDLVGNMMRSAAYEYRRNVDKLGKPVDRAEWHMTPQTVNAYYNPTMNEIVFPAAILQPPFFNAKSDDAANYGGIGAVIGHEISHAFDDQGSKYDGDGNLNNWWTDDDRESFTKLTSQLVDQYTGYRPLPGKNLNGKLTLGENIADLAGLSISYKAYQLSQNGKEPPVIADWTGDQRFYLGWSQVWRRKYRDAEMVRRLLIDPHSPSEFRANGPVMNIDSFYVAFDIKPGDKLFKPKEERIRIW